MADITVVMATYNGKNHLPRQIESILNQTRPPEEFIITDDASTDLTPDLLEKYASEHEMITVLLNDSNVGVNKNFQRGIERASGDYLAFADQDDHWYKQKLEYQLKVLEDSDAGLCTHDSAIVRLDKEEEKETFWEIQSFSRRGYLDSNTATSRLINSNFARGGSMMIRKPIAKNALPLIDDMTYDRYLAIHTAVANGVYVIDDVLADYIQHEDQVLGINSNKDNNRHPLGLGTGHKEYEEEAEKWGNIAAQIEHSQQTHVSHEKEKLINLFQRRARSSSLRATCYDPSKHISSRLTAFWTLWNDRYYHEFHKGGLSACKDLLLGLSTPY